MKIPFLAPRVGALDTLAETVARHRHEEGAFLVLRHSIRKRIWRLSVSAATRAPLKPAGRDLARSFGARLAVGPLALAASPVERCLETARCLAEGHPDHSGKGVQVEAWEGLGAPFFVDYRQAMGLFRRGDPRAAMEHWAAGAVDTAILKPFAPTTHDLVDSLFAKANSLRPNGFPVMVTHDVTLAALICAFMPLLPHKLPWPAYLEGALLFRRGNLLHLNYRGNEATRDS